MNFQIKPVEESDKPAISEVVQSLWGDPIIMVHGDAFDTDDLAGLKASLDDAIVGFLHYQVRGEECEILTLASLREGLGIGSGLIDAVERIARRYGCRSLSLITTNDNLHALGFYQRRGFHLTALYPGQVTISRKLKPSIPEIGKDGIPLRDELRLEKQLT